MASYVILIKQLDNEHRVIYKFGPNEDDMGLIELNKVTRLFAELSPVPGVSESKSKFFFDRAAQRLARCLIKEGGVFPDNTFFAS